MLLPNQQQKALFQLSVESAGGANVKRRFQPPFLYEKITTVQTFPSACLQLQQSPFGVAVPKRLCKNFSLLLVKAHRCASVFAERFGRCLW